MHSTHHGRGTPYSYNHRIVRKRQMERGESNSSDQIITYRNTEWACIAIDLNSWKMEKKATLVTVTKCICMLMSTIIADRITWPTLGQCSYTDSTIRLHYSAGAYQTQTEIIPQNTSFSLFGTIVRRQTNTQYVWLCVFSSKLASTWHNICIHNIFIHIHTHSAHTCKCHCISIEIDSESSIAWLGDGGDGCRCCHYIHRLLWSRCANALCNTLLYYSEWRRQSDGDRWYMCVK